MRLYRPFFMSGLIWPEMIFRIKTQGKAICLTFDDGPDPDTTPGILDLLVKHNISALFFCTGQKAERFTELKERIISGGHKVGNHGYFHLDGWKTSRSEYLDNVERASSCTSDYLFRPPYGRMKLSQYRDLIKTYTIIGWNLMPYDFDNSMGKADIVEILKKKIRPGSVVVLHDNGRSMILQILDEFIDYALIKGYKFILPEFSGKE
jgi:peptidoglycan-N-acetylglucosamine deacetylase